MATFGSSKKSIWGAGTSLDLNDLDTLETLVQGASVPAPKKSKVMSGLKVAGGILGATNSFMAGATEALVTGKNPTVEGPKAFWNSLRKGEVKSFSDVIKTQYKPETFGEKAGVETLGFVADVAFDPLTYLTFGVGKGVQIAGRTGTRALNKTGQRLYTESSGQLFKQMGLKGADDTAENLTKEVFSKALDGNLDNAAVASLKSRGVTDDIIEKVSANANRAFDEGGIKFAGKSVVKGETIAKSPVGKLSKKIKDAPIVQEKVDALKTLFSFGGKIDPRIGKLLEEGAAKFSKATDDIYNRMLKLFDGVSEKQLDDFFVKVDGVKRDMISRIDNKVGLMGTLPDSELKRITGQKVVKKAGKLTKGTKESLESIARKEVKKEMNSERLTFADQRLQKLADDMFEGKNAISKIMAKEAGLPEDQWIKFYIPTKFEEFERLAKGSRAMSSAIASAKKQKKFRGAKRKDLIRDPFRLYTTKSIELAAERIKSDTIKKVSKEIGISNKNMRAMVKDLTGATGKITDDGLENLAKKIGYEKVSRGVLLTSSKATKKSRILSDFKRIKSMSEVLKREIKSGVKELKGKTKTTNRLSRALNALEDKTFVENMSRIEKGLGDFTEKQVLDLELRFNNLDSALKSANIKKDSFESLIKQNKKILQSFKSRKKEGAKLLKGLKETESFYVPKAVAEEIKDLYKTQRTAIDTVAEMSGFDFATRMFKGYVTAPFPGFHVRNYTSNLMQNAIKMGIDALNPVLQKQGLDMSLYLTLQKPSVRKMWSGSEDVVKQIGEKTFQTKTGRTIKYSELIELIQNKSTFLDSGQFGDYAQMIKQGKKIITGKRGNAQRINPFSSEFAPVAGGRAVGNVTENQAKLVHIVSQIKEGKTIDEAIKSAEEVLFNYSKLTPFERTFMRRVIPFYTFMSRNMALQAKTLATQPGFIANQLKAISSAGKAIGGEFSEEEEEGLPDFIMSKLGIKIGGEEGKPQILSGFGLPIEEFLGRFSGEDGFMWNAITNTITQSNPLIKYPIERTSGVDLFYGRPIAEIRNADGLKSMFNSMPEGASNEMKALVGYYEKEMPVYENGRKVGTEVRGFADPIKLHLMRNLPTARLQGTQDFLTDSSQNMSNKALNFFTGAKVYNIDTDRQTFFKELERKKELQQFLIDVLGYKEFSSVYRPKD